MSKILEKIKTKYNTQEQMLIERAFAFAKKAHYGQKRKNGEEYLNHPLAVAETLSRLHLDQETVSAALLHDIIEDTNIGIEEIKKEFGENVAFLVEAVTKLEKIGFKGDQELAENFRKMILATAKDIRVVLIKLADVLHNAQTLNALDPSQNKRYAREVLEIYAPIAGRLGIGWLRGELEDLAFPYVFPKEHAKLHTEINKLVEENQEYIKRIETKVLEVLSRENIRPVKIDARVKHLFSLWKKLNRHDNDFSKIYDLVATRIIVNDVHSCYTALGALHNHWIPLPGRVKDYIALPKPSGYQSLHTTIFCDDGKITEFQIRTKEMHEEAEFGIAAHWAYKEDYKSFKKNLSWIKQLSDWQKTADSEEFLESLKIDFFKDRIFVFTPQGDVIDLPEGATSVDFAYAIHSDLGDKISMAKVNGKPVQLSEPLNNNDIVEVITTKNKKPSPDWLNFVKTSRARAKIKDALRKA